MTRVERLKILKERDIYDWEKGFNPLYWFSCQLPIVIALKEKSDG